MLMGHTKSQSLTGLSTTRLGSLGIDTCYYWVTDPKTGEAVCGNVGGGSAMIQGRSADLDQVTLNEIAGQVRHFAEVAAGLAGATTSQAQQAAGCAVDYFNTLVTLADVTSDNIGKLNQAANAAVRRVSYLNIGNLPCGLNYRGGFAPIPTIAAQLQQYKYGQSIPYCDDRSPAGLQDCQRIQQILAGSDFDIVNLIKGGGTARAQAPATQPQPAMTPEQLYALYQQQQQAMQKTIPAVNPYTPAAIVSSPGTAPAPTSLTTYEPESKQTNITSVAIPGTPAERLVSGNNNGSSSIANSSMPSSSVSPVDSSVNPNSPSASSTLASYMPSTSGMTDWISANPLLAVGIAVGAFMLLGRGK